LDWQAEVRAVLRQGNKARALQQVVAQLRAHPRDVAALLWFAGLTENREQAIAALRYVLRLDPENAAARRGLAALGARPEEGVRVAKKASRGDGDAEGPRQAIRLASKGRPSEVEPGSELIRGSQILRRAQATIWPFRGYNRPLGVLLEMGMVQTRGLEWAVKNARDPEIRWAAAVLLQEPDIQDLSMTEQQAAQVVFPFRQLNRPLGVLLREGHIGLRDLAYVVHRAYSPRLRWAAAVMGYWVLEHQGGGQESASQKVRPSADREMATRARSASAYHRFPAADATPAAVGQASTVPAEEPGPSRGPLRVYRGSRFLQRQVQVHERRVTWASYALRALVVVLAVFSVAGGLYLTLGLHDRLWGTVVTWSGVLILLAVSRVVPWFDRLKAQREAYRQGLAGEERLARLLRGKLDGRWALYRNLVLPDGQGDLDAVLLGPRGVYLLEVKAYQGAHRVRGGEWYRRRWGKWVEMDANPTRQAMRNALRLAEFLRARGLEVWVEPRVVWAGQGRVWIDGQPEVLLWDLNRPSWIWRDLGRGKPLPPETCQGIHQALHTLVALSPEAKP